MIHERTKAGRALLKLKCETDKWIEKNRHFAPLADLEAAEILACELYYAAVNGTAHRLLRRYSPTSRG
jgi:hypothetical protein